MNLLFPILVTVITLTITYLSGDYSKLYAYLLLMFCFSKARKSKYWFSPYYLFMVTIFSYILYWNALGGIYMDELSWNTRLYALSGLTAVSIGFFFCEKIIKRPIIIGNITENFFLVFFIGLLPTAISYILYGNIASLEGEEMLEAKEQFVLPVIGQLAYFLPASIVVACKKNNTKLIIISLIFSFLAAFLTISKTALLLTLVFFIIAISKFKPDIIYTKLFKLLDRSKFVVIPVLVLSMFIYNNNKRIAASGRDGMSFVESSYTTMWGNDNFTQNIFLNYCYYVQPWSNLNYNIENNHSTGSFGGNSFAQFGEKIGLNTNPRPKIQSTFFNTHTFLTDYYLDFGFFIGVIICFLIGIIIYFCYIKFGLSDDPLLIAFYILIAYATIMMFFSNHFNNGYLMNYFITFGLVSWFSRLKAK